MAFLVQLNEHQVAKGNRIGVFATKEQHELDKELAAQAELAYRRLVLVVDEDAQNALEMAAAEDEDPVKAVRPDCPYPPLGVGVRFGCPDRCRDDRDLFTSEDLVDGRPCRNRS